MPVSEDNDKGKQLVLTLPDQAIKYLYQRYYPVLVQVAERRTGDRKASEDIAQEVFISFWKNYKTLCLHAEFHIRLYLIGMVRKKSISYYYESGALHYERYPDAVNLVAAVTQKEFEFIEPDRLHKLKRVLLTLPVRQQQCIEMRFFDEMSIAAIAEALGISQKAVEKHITKALKNLRNHRW